MKANAQKIADGVYWIGVLDWDLRTYHGYTLDGTTYNAYLVFGEDKVALIDNAYPGKTKEMMARIDDAFSQEGKEVKVDYIIQNHVEKDHSGVLVDLHKRFPEAPIYCTEIAVKGLIKHYPSLEGAEFITVGTGDSLDVGGRTLAFLDAFLPTGLTACSPYLPMKPESYSLTTHSVNTYASPKDSQMKSQNTY